MRSLLYIKFSCILSFVCLCIWYVILIQIDSHHIDMPFSTFHLLVQLHWLILYKQWSWCFHSLPFQLFSPDLTTHGVSWIPTHIQGLTSMTHHQQVFNLVCGKHQWYLLVTSHCLNMYNGYMQQRVSTTWRLASRFWPYQFGSLCYLPSILEQLVFRY